jgi:hypothetical protein
MAAWRVGRHYNIHVYEGDRPVATFFREEDARQAVEDHNLKAQLAEARREGVMSIVGPLADLARAHVGRSPNRYDKVYAASVEQATIDARQYGFGVDGCVAREDIERLNRSIARSQFDGNCRASVGWTDGVLCGRAAEPLNNDHEQDGA